MPTTTDEKYRFIDSSVDKNAGWTTFGQEDTGVEPMLREGVGALGGLHGEPQAFHLFPTIDQRQMIEEIDANPGFGKKLTAMLHDRNAVPLVMASAKRAILNELNPKDHPESKGEWKTLRKRFNILVNDLPATIDKHVKSMTPAQRMGVVKAIAEHGAPSLQLGATAPAPAAPTYPDSTGGIIGGIVSAIAGAAGSIYAAKITTDAQKDVAKIQANTAQQSLQMQQQMAQNQALIDAARAAAGGSVPAMVMGPGGQMIPNPAASSGSSTLIWAIPAGLGVLGLVLYFVFRSRD